MIRAIAVTAGVVGVVAVSQFITDGEPTIAKWVDHIEHLIRVTGIDHVGVGADFFDYAGQIGASPGVAEWGPDQRATHKFEDMLTPEDLPGLTAELARLKLTEGDLRKIYRENFLRVMSAVEA